ncbi:two-component system response regulator [Sphingobacteriaceae bacterium]|nr:two-component system response regulator [Sphingobacteriaceae bacterium]
MNTKLRCLLLDDELPGLTYLRMLCEQISEVEVVRAFNDPIKFVEESKNLDFDFCILDIEMPGLSGLEVARILKNKPVIFTSAYKEYAAEAFDIDAVDYVRKPIEKVRLEKAIQKIVSQLNESPKEKEKQFIQLNTNKGKALLSFSQLIQVTNSSTDKRDKLAILETGEELVLKNISFGQLLSFLPTKEFCRINKKDVIAMRAVKFYSHTNISLINNQVLTLSDNFKNDFITKLRL